MPTYLEKETIKLPTRQKIIQDFPCFATLNAKQSKILAELTQEVSYAQGEVVVSQDEIIDAVYFIVKGQCEVIVETEFKKKRSKTPVAVLNPGESIGLNDTGFYSSTGKRTATVLAMTPLALLRLELKSLHRFLEEHHLESTMYAAAEQMLRLRLIKQCLPFGKLSHERLLWLCEKVEQLSVPADTIIFKQGDRGDKCYLIRSGKIEIVAQESDGSSHQLAILKPPTLFGEATLITQDPRNATARALETSELLVLSSEYLNEHWEKEQNVANMFMNLMVDRSRPSRNQIVTEYPRSTPDGRIIVILKNPNTASYFKLSQEGWYLWKQMNGQHTLLEITMALANQYQVFSPNMVVALISKLAHADFIQNVSTETLVKDNEPLWQKWLWRLIDLLQFRLIFKQADPWLTKHYNKGVYLLFTRLGKYLIATLAIAGFATFLYTENYIVNLFRTLHDSWILFACMIPLTMLTAILHELGHAFSTKFYGREVHSMGLGWNWTKPVAFADITDMWLDTRWHRIAVNAAGLYANAFVAGVCALLILVMPSYYLQAFLWLFALTTYIKGFAMLNPSQDLDGYYIMMDLFEQPHLRHKATAWLIRKFPAALKKPSLFLQHGPEVAYWVSCIIFLALTAIITLYVQGFVLKLLGMTPPNLFSALILPAIMVAVSSLTLISDIRKQD